MKFTNKTIALCIVAALLVGLAIGAIVGYARAAHYTPASNAPYMKTTVPQITNFSTRQSNTTQSEKFIEVLYSNKTVHIAAPQYNYNWSPLNGCYWIAGYYNFSFNVPYAGYIIFNETNTGKQNNKTFAWFSAMISPHKTKYYIISPYNLTGCTGEGAYLIDSPVSEFAPAKNQTMVIPVANGTNYMVLYNNNAYGPWAIDNPIDVTYSIKYVGFKPLVINNTFAGYMPSNSMKANYSFARVLVGNNFTSPSVQGFEVNLIGIGPSTPEGISPAIIRVYYDNRIISQNATLFPAQNLQFNASGHVLRVYVNQTDALYHAWATMYLSNS